MQTWPVGPNYQHTPRHKAPATTKEFNGQVCRILIHSFMRVLLALNFAFGFHSGMISDCSVSSSIIKDHETVMVERSHP
jgi:hypothetical protein